MYVTPEGKEIFVVDGHTHFWDGSPENQRNIHGKQFIECFYGYHTALSPPEQLWEKAKFEKYSAEDLYNDLFVDGPDDIAIVQSTYLKDFYKERLQHHRAQLLGGEELSGPLHRQRRLRPARRREGAGIHPLHEGDLRHQGREAVHGRVERRAPRAGG